MLDHRRHVGVKPFLPHALAATLAVIALPVIAVIALMRLIPEPSLLLIVLTALLATFLAIGVGVMYWRTRPESADIAFGELLIWGWLARKHADERLDEGVRLLGLDRSGQPTDTITLSPDQQLEVLRELNSALEAKDPYTHGHSQRVERHTYRTAAAMGLSVEEIEELRLAAALHDVGKIRVPDRVLRKPTQLTPEERSIVEEHTVVGAWMVSSVGSADVIGAVRHHHERWDGRGYPDGLSGSDIPLYARIIAVADSYDAITSTRPYRVSAGREHAVSVLKAESGTQFDPMIVNAFVDALPIRLPVAGAMVLLAGPTAFGRRLVMWFKRLGGSHLAPAAASLAAIVSLGAFISGPAVVQPPPRVVAQGEVAVENETQDRVKDRRIQQPETKTEDRKALVAQRGRVGYEGDIVLSETLTRAPANRTDTARPERGGPLAQAPDKPTLVRPDNSKPAPEKPEPTQEPEPEPSAPSRDEDPEDSEDSDEPDECSGDSESNGSENGEGHEKARGEGHQKHCD